MNTRQLLVLARTHLTAFLEQVITTSVVASDRLIYIVYSSVYIKLSFQILCLTTGRTALLMAIDNENLEMVRLTILLS